LVLVSKTLSATIAFVPLRQGGERKERRMDDWKPLEIVALVAVAAVAAVSMCALLAWYRLRHRQIELAACTSDDQAARLLAESLAKVGMTADGVEEIMTAFVRMDSTGKRSLAAAISGLVAATGKVFWPTLDKKVKSLVRGISKGSQSGV
jgi:HAMP domain-containing protein